MSVSEFQSKHEVKSTEQTEISDGYSTICPFFKIRDIKYCGTSYIFSYTNNGREMIYLDNALCL